MNHLLKSYGVLTCSLLTLLASGIVIGRLTAPPPTPPPALAADPSGSPEAWTLTATRALVRDLRLDASQQETIADLLPPVANALYDDQERTLFQMHLRLLLLHDSLAAKANLTHSQQQRLATSRAKLKDLIIAKFPARVSANPDLKIESRP